MIAHMVSIAHDLTYKQKLFDIDLQHLLKILSQPSTMVSTGFVGASASLYNLTKSALDPSINLH